MNGGNMDLLFILIWIAGSGCLDLAEAPPEAGARALRALPKPEGLDMSVGEALRQRQSTRKFDKDRKLSPAQVGTLLWAMNGINRLDPGQPRGGKRTAPSAYGACAVEVIITSAEGTFLYVPGEHALEGQGPAAGKDLRSELAGADWAKEAPLLVLLVASLDRYPEKTTAAERRDYSCADAGVMGENLYIACAALKLGTVLTVSSRPDAGALLGLGKDQRVIFAFPVGHPDS
jgi:nitroreductase